MPALSSTIYPRDSNLGKHRTQDSRNGNFTQNWVDILAKPVYSVDKKKTYDLFKILVLEGWSVLVKEDQKPTVVKYNLVY